MGISRRISQVHWRVRDVKPPLDGRFPDSSISGELIRNRLLGRIVPRMQTDRVVDELARGVFTERWCKFRLTFPVSGRLGMDTIYNGFGTDEMKRKHTYMHCD